MPSSITRLIFTLLLLLSGPVGASEEAIDDDIYDAPTSGFISF